MPATGWPPPVTAAAGAGVPMVWLYTPQPELQSSSVPATATARGCSLSWASVPARSPAALLNACTAGWASRAAEKARLMPKTSSQIGTCPEAACSTTTAGCGVFGAGTADATGAGEAPVVGTVAGATTAGATGTTPDEAPPPPPPPPLPPLVKTLPPPLDAEELITVVAPLGVETVAVAMSWSRLKATVHGWVVSTASGRMARPVLTPL